MPIFKRTNMAIDLGTANTLIFKEGEGVVLNSPSVIALRSDRGRIEVVALGKAAESMLGKTPANISAIRPLKDGVIADFKATELMLTGFIRQVTGSRWLRGAPNILICVPVQATQVERRAIKEAAQSAGAKAVALIDEPVAAAFGANLDIDEPKGSMVVDIGGGTTEIGILSLGGLVYSSSLKVAGNALDDAIITFIRRERGILIGERQAERIKLTVGSVYPSAPSSTMNIKGLEAASGLPRNQVVSTEDVYNATVEPVNAILRAVSSALEAAPPDISADVLRDGMVLTGGGALLQGLPQLISEFTGVPCRAADNPLDCVVMGGGKILSEMKMKNFLKVSES
jgi:rod shape-determining protein MreB